MPAALLHGTLIEEAGCLWIEVDGSRHLVLWPDGTYATVENDQLVVYNDGNRAVVGTRVSAGGGEYGADALPELIGEVVPTSCQESGHYWLTGSVTPAAP